MCGCLRVGERRFLIATGETFLFKWHSKKCGQSAYTSMPHTYTHATQKYMSPNKLLCRSIKHSCRMVNNKIVRLLTLAIGRLRFAGVMSLHQALLLISISNSAVIYRLIPPQAACTASSNETHWFGCDLKNLDSCAMWKRTYGSLSSSPTFQNNLDRTLSILSPPKTQQLHCRGIQLKVPSGVSILSVLWGKKTGKDLLQVTTVQSCFVTLSLIIAGDSFPYVVCKGL